MGNNVFDRTIFNPLEAVTSSDWNQVCSQLDRTIREIIRAQMVPHDSNPKFSGGSSFTPLTGFISDGFYVSPDSGMTLSITPGMGFIYDGGSMATSIGGVTGLDDRSPYYPVYLSAAQSITVPVAPGTGLERYDIIEVALDRRRENALSRDVYDTSLELFVPGLLQKTLAYELDGRNAIVQAPALSTTGIGYKRGIDAAIGAAAIPATTSGYTRIAVIYVVTGTTNITQSMIRDQRRLLFPSGTGVIAFNIYQSPGTPDTVGLAVCPGAHAGVRMMASATGSTGAPVKVYIFAGEVLTDAAVQQVSAYPIASCKNSSADVLIGKVSPVQAAVIDLSEQTALALAGFSVAIGQPYLYFTITKAIISGSLPAAWQWDVICPLSVY
jgi:hypothetical protein